MHNNNNKKREVRFESARFEMEICAWLSSSIYLHLNACNFLN